MSRRVRVPSADDLFRPTVVPDAAAAEPSVSEEPPATEEETGPRRPSGRVRHDEKMTVYVTAEELLDLEHARLALRRDHGLAVDRGRFVRQAVAIALADLDEHGADAVIVSRLTES